MPPARLVLVTTDTLFGRHMASRLAAQFDLRGVLIFRKTPPAPRAEGLNLWMRRTRRALKQLAAALPPRRPEEEIGAIERRLAARADRFFEAEAGPAPDWPAEASPWIAPDLNAPEVVAWVRGEEPDHLVIAGGPILKTPILSAARGGALNMHTSLLPAYRGTRAEFWQAHDQAFETVGVTIHLVDEGVDTGPTYLACSTRTPGLEDPWRLRARNLLAAVDLFPSALEKAASGTPPRPQPPGGRAYRYADITLAARARVLRNVGALPEGAARRFSTTFLEKE